MCYSGKCNYEAYSGDCEIWSREGRSCPPQVHKFKAMCKSRKEPVYILQIGHEDEIEKYEFPTEREAEEFLQGYQVVYKLQYGGRGIKINGEYNLPRRTESERQSGCEQEIS